MIPLGNPVPKAPFQIQLLAVGEGHRRDAEPRQTMGNLGSVQHERQAQ